MKATYLYIIILSVSLAGTSCEEFYAEPHQLRTYYGMRKIDQGIEFLSVDVYQGKAERVAIVNTPLPFVPGVFTYDTQRDYLVLGTEQGSSVFDVRSNRILRTIDGITEAEYDPNTDRLYGLRHDPEQQRWLFVRAAVDQGTAETVAALNAFVGIDPGSSTFDTKRGRYYVHTDRGLFGIDAATGKLVSSLQGVMNVEYNPVSGKLIGLKSGKPRMLVDVDIDASNIREIAEIERVSAILPGAKAYDALAEHYLLRTNLGITVVDFNSGKIVANFAGLDQIVVLDKRIDEIDKATRF